MEVKKEHGLAAANETFGDESDRPIPHLSEARVAHQESISICGIVSTMDPARETALSASFIGSPNTINTAIASMAVRPSPPAQ